MHGRPLHPGVTCRTKLRSALFGVNLKRDVKKWEPVFTFGGLRLAIHHAKTKTLEWNAVQSNRIPLSLRWLVCRGYPKIPSGWNLLCTRSEHVDITPARVFARSPFCTIPITGWLERTCVCLRQARNRRDQMPSKVGINRCSRGCWRWPRHSRLPAATPVLRRCRLNYPAMYSSRLPLYLRRGSRFPIGFSASTLPARGYCAICAPPRVMLPTPGRRCATGQNDKPFERRTRGYDAVGLNHITL